MVCSLHNGPEFLSLRSVVYITLNDWSVQSIAVMFNSKKPTVSMANTNNRTTAGDRSGINTGYQDHSHNFSHKAKEHWRTTLIFAVLLCSVCLGVPLGIVYGVVNRSSGESNSSQTAQPSVSHMFREPLHPNLLRAETDYLAIVSHASPNVDYVANPIGCEYITARSFSFRLLAKRNSLSR